MLKSYRPSTQETPCHPKPPYLQRARASKPLVRPPRGRIASSCHFVSGSAPPEDVGPDERHAPRAGVRETLRPVDRRRKSRQRCRPDDAVVGEA